MVTTREKWETESSLNRGASYDQLRGVELVGKI